MSNPDTAVNNYFRCGGCGRFVILSKMQEHYEGNAENKHKPHELGISVESPPAPATVANPPPRPMYEGHAIPPPTREPDLAWYIRIPLMYRSYKRAFLLWTTIVFILAGLFWTNLYAYIVFHI